jgi:excisionase family DNA binding protein
MDDRLALRPTDAAAAIGVSRTTMFYLLKQGEVRSILLGKKRLIPRSELEAFLSRKIGH